MKVWNEKFDPWLSAYAEQYRQEDSRTIDVPHEIKTQNRRVKAVEDKA
jgi:hypothetical protein